MTTIAPTRTPLEQDIATHPLFQFDARRIHWASRPRTASVRVILFSMLRLSVLWLVFSGLHFASLTYISEPVQRLYIAGSNILSLFLFLSIPLGALLDFVAMLLSFNSITGDMVAGRWDLLRLTSLSTEGMIAAKHAISQTRCWRPMLMLVGTRLGILALGGILLMLAAYSYGGGIQLRRLEEFYTFFCIIVLCAVYVIEPYWRMKAMTAVGVAISALNRSTTSAMLGAFGSLVGAWILQVLVVGVSMYVTSRLMFNSSFSGTIVVMCNITLLIAVFIGTLYGFFRFTEQRALERALARLRNLN
ncbi:MAG: hypothetical protein SF123_17215 [Chloroflexota bacterium]|nr:hypothetical protein [Chloroflexota bacterium]